MIKEVLLPEISENIDSGDVIKVLVNVGDKISLEQSVIEVETDKAAFEVPSTEEGIVKEIIAKEGEKINVGGVILKVETNESESAGKPEKTEPTDKSEDKEKSEVEKKVEKDEKKEVDEKKENDVTHEKIDIEVVANETKEEEKSDNKKKDKSISELQLIESLTETSRDENPKEDQEKIKEEIDESGKDEKNEKPLHILIPASPSVRRLARELGVDISKVKGTGNGDKITEDDVKNFIKNSLVKGESETKPESHGVMTVPTIKSVIKNSQETQIEKMSKVRLITAKTMSHSWNSVPQVTQYDKADVTGLDEFRKKYGNTIKEKGGSLTVTSILVKAVSSALQKFPKFNCSIDLEEQSIYYKKYYNIGIAVDTDRGLLVPVIKNADKKTLTDISIELTLLAEKARNKKITPDEMSDGTFTISNLGGIGGIGFSPIVYSPQVAILGVSRSSMEPVYSEGQFIPKMILPLSLSYDHRIIDGADAARFLRYICESLENPYILFL